MSPPTYRIEPLDKTHDRKAFCSGSAPLDRYFAHQVTQDIRRHITNCFVALDPGRSVAGYYTLSSASIVLNELPESLVKTLPRYPSVPAVRMGRLAVDRKFHGLGLGSILLADAFTRVISFGAEIATFAMLVEAKDDKAEKFYRHFGFIPFEGSPLTLFLPIETAIKCGLGI